jgi:hypothetical protein
MAFSITHARCFQQLHPMPFIISHAMQKGRFERTGDFGPLNLTSPPSWSIGFGEFTTRTPAGRTGDLHCYGCQTAKIISRVSLFRFTHRSSNRNHRYPQKKSRSFGSLSAISFSPSLDIQVRKRAKVTLFVFAWEIRTIWQFQR